jgi:hypothetical protein
MDLAPAFAAWLVIAWRAGATWMTTRGRGAIAFGVLIVLWATAVATSYKRARLPNDPTVRESAARATHLLTEPVAYARSWPTAYDLRDPKILQWFPGPNHVGPPALYINGSGWDLTTGVVPPATHFFVTDPAYLELEVETVTGAQVAWADNVRVAVDLEHLTLVSTTPTTRGARLRFALAAPLHGVHVAFVAFGGDDTIDRERSDFVLRVIRWRDQ